MEHYRSVLAKSLATSRDLGQGSERFLIISFPAFSLLREKYKMAANRHEWHVLFITLLYISVAKAPDRLIPLFLSLFSRPLHELEKNGG